LNGFKPICNRVMERIELVLGIATPHLTIITQLAQLAL
jgi:hypothetical protein